MQPLSALTSVMTTAAFHATNSGEIVESNAPFLQIMRCIPGDDWRRNIDEADRALLDVFWERLFTNPDDMHQPATFAVSGSDSSFQIRAQAVSNDAGEFDSAVGVVIADESSTLRYQVDSATGLLEHDAVFAHFEELAKNERSFVSMVVLLDFTGEKAEAKRTEAARQLLSVIRPNDLLTSDVDSRFILCAAGINSTEAAKALADRLIASLNNSSMDARVGLAFPNRDIAVATMVREAEAGAWASPNNDSSFAPIEDAA